MAKIQGVLTVHYGDAASVGYLVNGSKAPEVLFELPKYVGELAQRSVAKVKGATKIAAQLSLIIGTQQFEIVFSGHAEADIAKAFEKALASALVEERPVAAKPPDKAPEPTPAVVQTTDKAQVAALGEVDAPKKAKRSWSK